MGHADELADIFGVPTDGSNIDTDDDLSDDSQEGAYIAVTKSSEEVKFEDKAKIINNAIAEVVVEDSKNTNSSIMEDSGEEQEKRDFESIITDAKNAAKSEAQSESYEKMGEQERNSISSDEPEEIFGDSSKNGTKPEKLPDDNEQQSSQIEYKKMSNKNNSNNSSKEIDTLDDSLRKSGFIIDSPSAMFENFYEMKKAALRRHIPDGNKLPINKWSQEMHDAYVDMRINLNDKDIIADKMQSIQQKRDRIVQIKSVINSQYFLWKRISPMLTGQLARVVYEKPAVKQDGVNYEHIRDVEEYYGELEGLFETSKDILNNLDAAYDNLSRQVTLTGILPLPKKYGSSDNQGHTKTMSIDNDGFDSLDDNSSVKPSSSIPKMSKKNIDGPQEVSF